MAARHYNRFLQCSQQLAVYIRKISGRRVYMLIENRSPNTVIMNYDNVPSIDGVEGIQILAGTRYELMDPFAPSNEVIWFLGQNGSVLQNLNVTEGYAL